MHVLRTIHRRAEQQLGLITRSQLRSLGLSDSQIKYLITAGVVVRVHRGVYRLAGSPQSLAQSALAACLACGLGAVTSRRTAADLWRLVEKPSAGIEVTVPYQRRGRHAGVVVHRTTTMEPRDVTTLGKVPITTVKRTIRDLPREFKEETFDTAIRDRRITPHVFVDERGYLGKLARHRLGLGVPHWKIERKAIEIIRKARLPNPVRQHPVCIEGTTYRIDLAYPEKKIAIELRGEAPHLGRDRFQHDIDRSNALKLDGWDEYTFTWLQVTTKPDDVAVIVRKALGARDRAARRGSSARA